MELRTKAQFNVTGSILGLIRSDRKAGIQTTMDVAIDTEKTQPVVLKIYTMAETDRLKKGDSIELMGKLTAINGEVTLVAEVIKLVLIRKLPKE